VKVDYYFFQTTVYFTGPGEYIIKLVHRRWDVISLN